MFHKFRVIECEYIVKISRGIVKHAYKVMPFTYVILMHEEFQFASEQFIPKPTSSPQIFELSGDRKECWCYWKLKTPFHPDFKVVHSTVIYS